MDLSTSLTIDPTVKNGSLMQSPEHTSQTHPSYDSREINKPVIPIEAGKVSCKCTGASHQTIDLPPVSVASRSDRSWPYALGWHRPPLNANTYCIFITKKVQGKLKLLWFPVLCKVAMALCLETIIINRDFKASPPRGKIIQFFITHSIKVMTNSNASS